VTKKGEVVRGDQEEEVVKVTKKGEVVSGLVRPWVQRGVSCKRGIRRRGPVTKPSPKDRTLKKFRLIFCHSPPGCVIPRPAVPFPPRLCHSPPGCVIPRPAVFG
jgi:hypothetical protein